METIKHFIMHITEITKFNILFNFKHFKIFFILIHENMSLCCLGIVPILLSLYMAIEYKRKYNQIPTRMFQSFQLKINNLL